ncbi:MAG: hypothetical protein IKF39_13015 [Oscillospiraceae bacterium]|jgi:hypothetical protein|nr:hypothetical protein [Oscillospiraceae bacterium]MBR3243962.1 hypothetical protein [Parasporobacterium sp.]
MTDNAVMIKVNDFEQRLLVNGMNRFRNDLIREDLPTEDVDDVLLKIIDAPPAKRKKADREAR